MVEKTKEKYIESVGRRKTAVARVRITPATKNSYKVNDKSLADYFKTDQQRKIVESALNDVEMPEKYSVSAKVSGSGLMAQAESIRLGISRALVKKDSALRGGLKKLGYLKRDPRSKERKKFGLKGARKSPQWSKR